MLIVIAYDISQGNNGLKRLTKIHKICQKHGQRVQNSLYECKIDWRTYLSLKNNLEKIIDKGVDSITIYKLGNNWENSVERIGK